MRNWKRISATALAAMMMVSSTMTMAYAEETAKNGWVYNEDEGYWNFYRNGKMMVSSLQIGKEAYYLGADGEMAAGEILDLYHKADDDGAFGNVFEVYYDNEIPKYVNKKGVECEVPFEEWENITTVYAKPDGRLANNNWIILDGEEVAYNEDSEDAAWHYFGDNDNTDNVWGNGVNGTDVFNAYEYQMVVEKSFKQGGYKYRMDADGEMYRAEWYTGTEPESIPEEEYKYYSYFGNMVQGHDDEDGDFEFRYLDGEWFAFKEDGTPMNVIFTEGDTYVESGNLTKFEDFTIPKDSESGKMKRLATVEDVSYSGDDEELVYEIVDADTWEEIKNDKNSDEWMSILFDVELATPANASLAPELNAKFHDIYLKRDLDDNEHPGMLTGSIKAKLGKIDKENSTIEVRFAAGSTGTTWLTLYVDGEEETVAVHSVLPQDEDAAAASAKTIIANAFGSAGSGLETANVEGLKSLANGNEIIADALLDNIVDLSDDVAALESSYSMVMGVTSTNETSEDAAAALGGNTVSTVGLALNMDDEGVAAFNVESEEDTMGLEEEFEDTVAFDYSVTLGGKEETEFDVPFVITTPIPDGMDADDVEVYHSHDGAEPELIENVTVDTTNETISFAVDKLSTFIFVQGALDDDGTTDDGTTDDGTTDDGTTDDGTTDDGTTDDGTTDDGTTDDGTTDDGTTDDGITDDGTTDDGTTDNDNTGNNNSGTTPSIPEKDDDDDDNEPAYTKDYISSTSKAEATVKEETTAGQWIQNETGWWFKLADGTYPVSEWRKLSYNGKTDWYRFNADGYMVTGWFTAADGNIYYLNPVSNGWKGAMLTGWQFIDGFWYYFNPIDDAIQGAMYRNTTTPDDYQVDANGRWIQ